MRKKFEELEWIQRGRISAGMGDPAHIWALESTPEVRDRNRYMNVQAWAHSRIRLKVPEGECDFINASPIVLKDTETEEEARFIATQVCYIFSESIYSCRSVLIFMLFRGLKRVIWRISGI